ncbi:MAG: hypothetical protein FJ137_11180 [Deltaproteobacteria bacterium]|nr:hypothetical protein [Deltaproteobacteria bacterium]
MIAALPLVVAAQLAAPPPTPPAAPTSPAATTTTMSTGTTTTPADKLAAGVYRLNVEISVATALPVIGEQHTTTQTTSIVTVADDGQATAVACSVETRGPAFTSRLPPASIQSLPTSRLAIVVRGDRVVVDMGEGQIGWRGSGPLPTSAADPRVADDDRDGEPGVRLDLNLNGLGTWPLQIVTRGHTVLDGTRTPEGATGVLSRMESEQQILSGLPIDIPLSDGPVRAVGSGFVLRRIEAPTCADLR